MGKHISRVRLLQGLSDSPGLDVYINDCPVQTGFNYGEMTEAFDVFPGVYNLKLCAGDTTILEQELAIDADEEYTLAFSGALGGVFMQVLPESREDLENTKAYIRFINLAPHYTEFDISNVEVTGLRYEESTGYLGLKPGGYSFGVHNSQSGECVLETAGELGPGERRSLFITGLEGIGRGLEAVVCQI